MTDQDTKPESEFTFSNYFQRFPLLEELRHPDGGYAPAPHPYLGAALNRIARAVMRFGSWAFNLGTWSQDIAVDLLARNPIYSKEQQERIWPSEITYTPYDEAVTQAKRDIEDAILRGDPILGVDDRGSWVHQSDVSAPETPRTRTPRDETV